MTQSVTELSLPTPKERRRLREAAELTHEEVAAAVGVTATTVRSWETGRTHPRGRKREAYVKLLTRLATVTDPASDQGEQAEQVDADGAAAVVAAAPDGASESEADPTAGTGRPPSPFPTRRPGPPGPPGPTAPRSSPRSRSRSKPLP